jgi:hypothetical protein
VMNGVENTRKAWGHWYHHWYIHLEGMSGAAERRKLAVMSSGYAKIAVKGWDKKPHERVKSARTSFYTVQGETKNERVPQGPLDAFPSISMTGSQAACIVEKAG